MCRIMLPYFTWFDHCENPETTETIVSYDRVDVKCTKDFWQIWIFITRFEIGASAWKMIEDVGTSAAPELRLPASGNPHSHSKFIRAHDKPWVINRKPVNFDSSNASVKTDNHLAWMCCKHMCCVRFTKQAHAWWMAKRGAKLGARLARSFIMPIHA